MKLIQTLNKLYKKKFKEKSFYNGNSSCSSVKCQISVSKSIYFQGRAPYHFHLCLRTDKQQTHCKSR